MMKKLILSVAVLAVGFGGFSVLAQDKKDSKKDAKCTEQTCKKDGKKDAFCPFEGLNLTDAQKEQLKQLREAKPDKAQKKELKKELKKEAKKEAREAKKEARINERREQLAKVKAILTPEQYVAYLENLVVNPQFRGKMPQQARKGDPRPEMRRDGQRPAPQARPQLQEAK